MMKWFRRKKQSEPVDGSIESGSIESVDMPADLFESDERTAIQSTTDFAHQEAPSEAPVEPTASFPITQDAPAEVTSSNTAETSSTASIDTTFESESSEAVDEVAQVASDDETSSSLGRIDKVLIAASVAIFFISVGLLFSDRLFSDLDTSNLTAIGKIEDSQSDVRRKVANGFAWDSISTQDRVFEGDSIFTGNGSKTRIQLESGTSFEIDEKSLVVVRSKNGALELDLQYGSLTGEIKTSDDKPVFLVDNGQKTQIKSKDAKVTIKKKEGERSARVQVVKGEAQIGSKKLTENQKVEPKREQASLSITLTEPASQARIWKRPDQKVTFGWKSKTPAENLRLEFARDGAFKDVVKEINVSGNSTSVSELPDVDGPLYWRVRDEAKMHLSIPRRFTVFADVAPTPTSPEDQQEFSLSDKEDNKAVALSWDDFSGSRDWRVQVAQSSSFADVIQDVKISKRRVETKPLPQGRYFWRVAGTAPGRQNPPWSQGVSFTVSGAIDVQAPAIVNKISSFEIPATDLKRHGNKKGPVALSKQAPALKWQTAPHARGYVLEVATDKTFSKPSRVKLKENVTSFKMDRVMPKTFFWRVSSIGRGGKTTLPSETGELAVVVPAPKVQPLKPIVQKFENSKAAKSAKASVAFKWSNVPQAAAYELELSKSSDFKKSHKVTSKQTSKKLAVVAEGSYLYRVRAVDSKGQPISSYSKIESLDYQKTIVKPTPPPARAVAAIPPPPQVKPDNSGTLDISGPLLKEPSTETSVVGFGKSPVFLNFRWKPVAGATGYQIQISNTPDFASKISTTKTAQTNFFFEKNLPKGKIFWRVRAEIKTDTTKWSDPNTFNVQYK